MTHSAGRPIRADGDGLDRPSNDGEQNNTRRPKSGVRSFALVPAAGRSERMGRSKLLLPWGDSTLIEHTLAAWAAGGVTRTIVVVNPDDALLIERARAAHADVVIPAELPPEMKVSVNIGLRHVAKAYQPTSRDVWLLAPADMPTLSPQVIQVLLNTHDPQAPTIVVPVFRGRQGHPVLFPWPFAADVSRLPEDEGINSLVRGGPTRTIEQDEHAVPDDVDTPEDYRRLRSG